MVPYWPHENHPHKWRRQCITSRSSRPSKSYAFCRRLSLHVRRHFTHSPHRFRILIPSCLRLAGVLVLYTIVCPSQLKTTVTLVHCSCTSCCSTSRWFFSACESCSLISVLLFSQQDAEPYVSAESVKLRLPSPLNSALGCCRKNLTQ